ncbi:MAG: hypothetical protein PWP51_2699 [Clostridiales bacterium]|nr:hypothetical protein [Clostridiales bacterium]
MKQANVNLKTAALLKRFLEEIVFIELKNEIGNWPTTLPMPVYIHKMAAQIREDQIDTISTEAIVRGVVTVMGADPSFKYASAYIEQLEMLDDGIWQKVVELGLAQASQNAYLEAILHFNAVLVADENNVNALYNMGRAFDDLYLESQDRQYLPFIKHCYDRTVELAPDFGPVHFALGFFYYNEEKYAQAEAAWLEALKCNISYDMREEVVSALGRVEDRSTFEQGREYILNGRFEEGLELLKSIEEIHDDWWQLNFFIGLALKMQERYEDALSYFLKVLVLNSGFVQAMNEAGICLIAIGDYEQALAHYREALRLSPKNPEYLCNRGVVYYHMKAYDDAFIAIDEAHALAPDDEVIQMWYQHIQTYLD